MEVECNKGWNLNVVLGGKFVFLFGVGNEVGVIVVFLVDGKLLLLVVVLKVFVLVV